MKKLQKKSEVIAEGTRLGIVEALGAIRQRLNEHYDNDYNEQFFVQELINALAEEVTDLVHNDPEYGSNPADYFDTELDYIDMLRDEIPATVAQKLLTNAVNRAAKDESTEFVAVMAKFLESYLQHILTKAEESI